MWDAGVTSENVAEKYGITRAQQDELAARSHKRAAAARSSGRFRDEIVPVKTMWKDPKTVRICVQTQAYSVNHLEPLPCMLPSCLHFASREFVWGAWVGDNKGEGCAG